MGNSTSNFTKFHPSDPVKTSQNFMQNFNPTDFEQFSDKDLYKYCKIVGFNARKWHRRFIAILPEVAKRRLYKKYGYCSIHEFAAKMAGVSHANIDEVLRVNEKFMELPKIKALIGEVGLSKLKVVACIATKDTDEFWAEKVKNLTKSSLEIYIKEMRMEGHRKNSTGNYNNAINKQEPQGRIAEKFPGELNGENQDFPQQKEQIGLFDSEKPISQNDNDARVENIQNHNKKTFTIQIDNETEFELRKFKQLLEKEKKEPVDWNTALKELVKRENEKLNIHKTKIKSVRTNKKLVALTKKQILLGNKKTSVAPVSRHIPVAAKRDIEQKYNGRCGYTGCNKPAEQIHHPQGFALRPNHKNLVPLCKNHHDFVHQIASNQPNKFKLEHVAAGFE
ncbi:hypothetical protein JW911_04735 [Candidatus Peregrinibacteria bacterium]|nr:hypothetical protein [Candidatus Peregrinibacteria bacterium]